MALQSGKFIKTTDVVISGISGVFPQSDNVEELKQNLLCGKDMITDNDRWDTGDDGVNRRMGLVKTLDRFDSSFFRISRKQAESMNVSTRILHEKVFEAIVDAGYNPQQFRGTNTGVFVGLCNDEKDNSLGGDNTGEYIALSSLRSATANRISYWLDVHGPSVILDSACSTSLYALEMAYKAIQNGNCDAAIVCTVNLCMLPLATQALHQIGVLSPDGVCRPFDANANGFVRSEAIIATLIQKKQDARRVYANVVYAKTNCDGFTLDGFFHPSIDGQSELFRKFYQEIDVDPVSVIYLEAHSAGTKVGDVVEVNAIEKIFCPDKRSTPLKIGSVKSNLGHTEASAGLCALAKVIISFETGIVPPNLHFDIPHPKIEGFRNGNIEVVTKPIPYEGKYYAMNSYGVGGANGHVLLSPNEKTKDSLNLVVQDIPVLVTVSGRTEEAVNVILNDVEKNIKDAEYVRLWHEIFSEDISGHYFRGYILSTNEKKFERNIKEFTNESRPVWFIFSGMGSQWPAMGKSLMSIPIFAESIHKSHKILETKGLDLIRIITDDDPIIFKNIMNSFIGIAAIQVALVDTLRAVGIKPNGMIGHSVGELGCAYADQCLTDEQMLLAAYYRGLVSLETKFIHGTMAAIGAGYNDIKDIVPPEIDVACHNGPDNSTISGPTGVIKEFMEELKQKDIFVREVNVSNIPYHSRYITAAKEKLISYMEKVIPAPKLRSEKWICTSDLENEWSNDKVKYASAEYFTNNLLNPVYFEEGSRHIPNDAVIVEIAPHGLLQAILKRSLLSTIDNISLTLKDCRDSAKFLINALGQIYLSGGTPKVSCLYPPIQFPVSRKTPMISPLIKWQHKDQWNVSKYTKKSVSGERDVLLYLNEHEYLRDHIIDGRNLYPATGYLCLVWETLAGLQGKRKESVSVVFENVRFERATNIQKTQNTVSFHISIQVGSGHFEITENNATVVSGLVRVPEDINLEKIDVSSFTDVFEADTLPLKTQDFYKVLRLRGYHYKGLFKKVQYAKMDGTYGRVSWCNNFVSFMDTLAQISILQKHTDELIIPTFIRKIIIDIDEHSKILRNLDEKNSEIPVYHYPEYSLLSSGGVQIIDFDGSTIPRKRDQERPTLEKYQFVPYVVDEEMDLNTAVRLCVNIVLENVPKINVKILEMLGDDYNNKFTLISRLVADALSDIPMIKANISILKNEDLQETPVHENLSNFKILEDGLPSDHSCSIIIIASITSKLNLLEKIFGALENGGFLLIKEPLSSNISYKELGLSVSFSRMVNADERIVLLSKIAEMKSDPLSIKIENSSYSWISEMQRALTTLKSNEKKLIVYSEKEPLSGILGFFNCLRKEGKCSSLRCFFLMDQDAPEFSLQHSMYKTQFERNLSHNVYKNGRWGSYRHIPLEPVQDIEVYHAYITQLVVGNFSTLRWVEGPISFHNKSSEQVLIHVYYSALNFRDIMIGAGKISPVQLFDYDRYSEWGIGCEFSGKDEEGKRYIGMIPKRGISNLVKKDESTLIWRVPDHMTLEEASTIAVVYGTVVYAFFFKINLRKGCSVLIHAGSGGIGQAAINICLHYGCEIFTTVGTPEKVNYIRHKFPQIPENHIGNSRNTSFEKMIMKETRGKGVDVVLNSLAEDKLRASMRCVAKGGDFIEIGKFDLLRNNSIDLRPFINSVSFHSIQMDDRDAMKVQSEIEFRQKVQEMLDTGIIKPIDRIVFTIDEVENAIRYMATGKHLGKVIIKIRNEDDIHAKPLPAYLKAQSRVLCKDNKSYLIIGGLGGFGIELADWLVGRGAKNIVLSSRTGIKNGYQSYKLKSWESYGVNVVVSTEDVTTETGAKNLLEVANSLAPLSSIFNVAVVLNDDQFSQQTGETFHISASPKSIATLNLDKLSRQMCPHLEHFVVFSSVSCGRGNPEQTNYGMSNSIMERICEARKACNLPALAIQWGAIGDVGVVADLARGDSTMVIGGTLQQKIKSCLETLDQFMHQSNPIVSSMVIAEKRSSDTDIITHIANILGINDIKTIKSTWTLPELGMDSIIMAEVKQLVELEFGTFLTPQDMKDMTFGKLYAMKEEKSLKLDEEAVQSTKLQSLFNEKLINIPLVRIPFKENQLNEEISVRDNTTVFFFPGIEGIAKLVEPLAKNLTWQVLCFQYLGDDVPKCNFQETSHYFSQLITDRLVPDQEFRIIGHSLGTVFALEVANILNKQGRKGYLWMIDGSPAYLRRFIDCEYFVEGGNLDDESLQCYLCTQLIAVVLPQVLYKELLKRVREAKNWEARKTFCFSMLSKQFMDKTVAEKCLDNAFQVYRQLFNRECNAELLDLPCTLIRTVDNPYKLDEAYGLSEYFKQPVRVHQIENANHFSILGNIKTAEIIMAEVTDD